MENNQGASSRVNQVTSFSKYVALALFVVLPFIGAYVGYQFGVVSVPQSVVVTTPLVGGPVAVSAPAEVSFAEQTDFYTISTVYPDDVRDTDHVMAKYVEGLVATKQAEWKTGGEMQLDEASATADFPDKPKVTYLLDVRYSSTTSVMLGTVSYVFMVSEMTGGASGNVVITTFTFDTNGSLSIESILDFTNGNDIALSKFLASTAVTQHPELFQNSDQLQQGLGLAYLKSDGVTFDATACGCDGFFFGSNFQNFSVTDAGLVFTFSKYAIAPGAAMTPDITLTWTELTPFLMPAFAKRIVPE